MKLEYGWAGKVLDVNLSEGRIEKKPLDEKLALNFIGGRGLNGWVLFNEIKPTVDPTGPENILLFGIGPVTGTLLPGAGRFTVTSKSPLTGIYGDSSCGGSWGAELKYAGYDQLIIRGKANRPVYIYIDGEEVKILDAAHIWGKDTFDTQELIKKELKDPRVEVCCIGPAGENLVKYATILARNRVAGRTGMGCVMGSKNLKAIAIKGCKDLKIAEPREFRKLYEKMKGISANDWLAKTLSMAGTAEFTENNNTILGSLSAYNARQAYIDPRKARKLSGNYFVHNFQKSRKACFACGVPCSSFFEINRGPFSGLSWDKIEFATIGRFTVALGIENLEVALQAGMLCDRYGIDTISFGSTLAWAYECFAERILTVEETGGLKLSWGNPDPVFALIKQTAYQEGFGKLIAEGVRKAAGTVGRGSEKYALHSKGLESICADARAHQGKGLEYAVCSRGFDHLRALPFEAAMNEDEIKDLFDTEETLNRFSTGGKGKLIKWFEDLRAVHDSLIVCKWSTAFSLAVHPDLYVEMLNMVTGLDFETPGLLKAGEKIMHLEKAFNMREGLTRKDDRLPERYLKEPIPEGPSKGQVVHLDELLDQYYMARGWDVNTGLVPKNKFEGLGLNEIAEDLEKAGKLAPS